MKRHYWRALEWLRNANRLAYSSWRSRQADVREVLSFLKGRRGLEIGGPSGAFRRDGFLPVYSVAKSVDNCNYAAATAWAKGQSEGTEFVYDRRRPPGRQFVREATAVSGLGGQYDFICASHVLEHCANPLGALREWISVLHAEGVILVVLPHRDATFDHRRPVTRLEHLLDDFENSVDESDLTHLEEILRLHDLAMDPQAGSHQQFRDRCERNVENRCLHHHVFDTRLVVGMLDLAGLSICHVFQAKPHHIVALARVCRASEHPDNAKFLSAAAECYVQSPFRSDRAESPELLPRGPAQK